MTHTSTLLHQIGANVKATSYSCKNIISLLRLSLVFNISTFNKCATQITSTCSTSAFYHTCL